MLRQRLVVLAARLGRSRRIVSETLGLSTARIQQLSESPSAELLADVEEFVVAVTQVAALLGPGIRPRDELSPPRGLGGDEFDETIDSMISVGLAEEVADNGLRLTEDGFALLEKQGTKRKPVKSDQDRERAGSATG